MDFKNKVVIITGASAGIGSDTALVFAKLSAKLVLISRNVQALNNVSQICKQLNGLQPLIVRAEMTNDDDVKNIITKTIETFGRIDVLVNNAGIGLFATITNGVEPFDKIMNTNIRSAYLLTSLAVPYIVESKGNIINVSSIAGSKIIKHLNFLPYGISKAAMDLFTKSLAVELGSKGVRVNSVNPGATKTGFLIAAGCKEHELKHKVDSYIERNIPLGKIAESNEVADLIIIWRVTKLKALQGAFLL